MSTIRIFLVSLLAILMSSCKIGRFAVYNFANITDHKIFPSRPLKASPEPYRFVEPEKEGIALSSIGYKNDTALSLSTFLERTGTVAFIIIRNDTILLERYANKYSRQSIIASFSMAKSVVSALIGIAIHDSLIKSIDDPVTNYIPELSKNGFDHVTIRHLLQMTSGLKYNESYYNPFGDAATSYYGRHLREQALRSEINKGQKPGGQFKYTSGTTQLLGLVLERALVPRSQTITEYLQEKLWGPMGMEYDASWSLDRKKGGMEKAFCCVNARARDFAKFGKLYLNNGNWNGVQLVPEEWVKATTAIDTSEGSVLRYNYQWWIRSNDAHDFDMNGHLGQYVYVNRNSNTVIVRLGKKWGKYPWVHLFKKISGE